MSASDAELGARVRKFRRTTSQQQIAEAMKAEGHAWSQSTIWSVETGQRPLRLSEALSLAQILDVELSDLALPAKARSTVVEPSLTWDPAQGKATLAMDGFELTVRNIARPISDEEVHLDPEASGRRFAKRIAAERLRRGWSQGELARKMRAAGYALDQAAISKIERPPADARPRRIDIDEAIGFARLFGTTVEALAGGAA